MGNGSLLLLRLCAQQRQRDGKISLTMRKNWEENMINLKVFDNVLRVSLKADNDNNGNWATDASRKVRA